MQKKKKKMVEWRFPCGCCVFFDLSKAFDKLPHSLILQALVGVGVGGPLLSWFKDYLSGRHQAIRGRYRPLQAAPLSGRSHSPAE